MTQIERIEYMEQILDEAEAATQVLLLALERYRALKPRMAELEAYYTSPQWMRDYEDDCAGRLPEGLRRGVLSEDAVYDLLHMQNVLQAMWEEA
ncbi:MAG: DUF4298 domain-containing protein [Clostridia bacterium]|nr:DUF4298 domain-containing protein [Clostridia bacterium]